MKRIYVLIREKKGKTSEERFKDLFDDPVSRYYFISLIFFFILFENVVQMYLFKIRIFITYVQLLNFVDFTQICAYSQIFNVLRDKNFTTLCIIISF